MRNRIMEGVRVRGSHAELLAPGCSLRNVVGFNASTGIGGCFSKIPETTEV